MKVSILGAGNAGTQLALAISKAGHTVQQVWSRTPENAQALAQKVNATAISEINALSPADVILIAVKDDAIALVAAAVNNNTGIVAHTSGTVSLDAVSTHSSYGVFYPLQTMKQDAVLDFSKVPLLVEYNNDDAKGKLLELAKSISGMVYEVDSEQRSWVHVAAVFANNFTNHLFALSERILTEHGLPQDILKPLISRFIKNMAVYSAYDMQTGPAMRRDYDTINKHMLMLADEQKLKTIYEILSSSIISTYYGKEK